MEVIYSAKYCKEEDSDENGRNDQINQDNILEQISSDSILSSEINSFENKKLPGTINNSCDNENDFDEISIKENIPEKIPSNETIPFVIYENNQFILNNKSNMGFNIGPIFKPCTKGIWIWSEPIMIKNSNSINDEEFPCFMIDTEGLGAYDEEVNHDSKYF